ncbi:hypothetical protein ACUXV3_12865 [Roseobacteraceae bacterium NS-SX3]
MDLRPLPFILASTLTALAPAAADAGPDLAFDCVHKPYDRSNCSPLVACLGGTGIYFTGRAVGWNEGTFAGATSANYVCTGRWQTNGFLGLGEAVFECSNGTTGMAYFTSRDPATGTASGLGRLSNGLTVQMWSGKNVQQFLLNKFGEVDQTKLCRDLNAPTS